MLLSEKRSEGCTKDDWTCNLEKRKNERPNGEKKSHVHIEKLNLPCRYFFAHLARSVYPKCMLTCLFIHILQWKRLCWFCGAKEAMLIIYSCLHLSSRPQTLTHTLHCRQDARITRCSAILNGRCFFAPIENNKFQCNKTKDSSEFL